MPRFTPARATTRRTERPAMPHSGSKARPAASSWASTWREGRAMKLLYAGPVTRWGPKIRSPRALPDAACHPAQPVARRGVLLGSPAVSTAPESNDPSAARVLALAGPTAAGKSDAALHLAHVL